MFARLLRLFKVESMIKPDLVQGELPTTKQAYKDVLQIALPSIMELVLISLINSMDTMMVGTCGDAAIAAVGLVGQPRMLLMALFFALNIGVTALVARRKGEGRREPCHAQRAGYNTDTVRGNHAGRNTVFKRPYVAGGRKGRYH